MCCSRICWGKVDGMVIDVGVKHFTKDGLNDKPKSTDEDTWELGGWNWKKKITQNFHLIFFQSMLEKKKFY